MGEKNAQDWNRCRQFGREPSWTFGVAFESTRLAQGSKFGRGYPSASPCKTEETGPSHRKTAPINLDGFDQFTLLSLDQCAKGPQIMSEKCCTVATSRDEHQRHCFVCSVLSDRCFVACFHPVCHDCSHETLCTICVCNVDGKNNCPNDSFSPVDVCCVKAEGNIVEEEQNMWRRVKKGTKLQLDAGRRSALLLSSQRVKPHLIAESLITSTIKNALSRAPREALPATRVRVRP